jgi:hypothetical protein
MTPIHAKSPCCGALVRHFGKRRRQCAYCKRTWRIRKKKRGRKRTRHTEALLKRILIDGYTLLQERQNFHGLKSVSIAARFAQALRAYVTATPPRLPKGPYVLIVDGVYFKFKRKEWVLYLMALKPIRSPRMYYLDPVLLKGRERLEEWYTAIDTIPRETRKQIGALVSDGLRGFQQLAATNGWVHQRCHFHLLASLVRGKGKRRYLTRGSSVRDKILESVRILLADESVQKRDRARRSLHRHIRMCASMFWSSLSASETSTRISHTHIFICQPPRVPWNQRDGWCARQHEPRGRRNHFVCVQLHFSDLNDQWFATGVIHQIN